MVRECGCSNDSLFPILDSRKKQSPARGGALARTWRFADYPAITLTVRRLFGPCVLNSTLPSTSAYNV